MVEDYPDYPKGCPTTASSAMSSGSALKNSPAAKAMEPDGNAPPLKSPSTAGLEPLQVTALVEVTGASAAALES